jgi:hypothetical protein
MKALEEEFTPGQPLSDLKMDINFKALEDLDIADIEKATWHLINTRKTASFPKVAEIREAITGNPDEKALLAYDAFTKGKERTGIYQSVSFEDKAIHAVVEAMGGWITACEITEDEWKYRRREFLDLYKALSRANREAPAKLIGLGERGCATNPEWEKHIRPVTLIGCDGMVVGQQKMIEDKESQKSIAHDITKKLGVV